MRLLLLFLLGIGIFLSASAQTTKPISVDDFFEQPFGFEETVAKLTLFSGIKFKVKKEPVPNLHSPAVIDTVYHLKKGKNSIWLFKGADGNAFVYKATLCSKKVKMAAGISPGMSRNDFYSRIRGLKDKEETVHTFHNSGKNATGKATFKRGKLKRIDLEYNVD